MSKVIQIAVAQADNDGPGGVVVLDDLGRVAFRAFVERDPLHWMMLPPLPPVEPMPSPAQIAEAIEAFAAIDGVRRLMLSESGVTTKTATMLDAIRKGTTALGVDLVSIDDPAHG